MLCFLSLSGNVELAHYRVTSSLTHVCGHGCGSTTTGKLIFAVRQNLCHALFRTDRKNLVCHAFFLGPTSKKKHAANDLFVVHQQKTHGKRVGLPCIFSSMHGKVFLSPSTSPNKCNITILKNFTVRFFPNAWQTHVFVMHFSLTHSKLMSLSCAFFHVHGKIFFHFEVFLHKSKIQLLFKNNLPRLEIFFYSIHRTCGTSY
jgi:hypothetical protein